MRSVALYYPERHWEGGPEIAMTGRNPFVPQIPEFPTDRGHDGRCIAVLDVVHILRVPGHGRIRREVERVTGIRVTRRPRRQIPGLTQLRAQRRHLPHGSLDIPR